jgi:hypothetical protein
VIKELNFDIELFRGKLDDKKKKDNMMKKLVEQYFIYGMNKRKQRL